MSRPQNTRCLICNKNFKTPTRVLQHMNQPNSRCNPSLHPAILQAAERFKKRRAAQDEGGLDAEDVDEGDRAKWDGIHAEDTEDEDEVRFGGNYSEADLQNTQDEPIEDLPTQDPDPQPPWDGPTKDFYEGAAETFDGGETFQDKFQQDRYAKQRETNLHYPFASSGEWELAAFLNGSGLSLAKTEQFLKLPLVGQMNLSFKTAKELRSRIESLPKGPLWKSTTWKTPYPTKKPLTLYYRDPIECLQSLMSNPLLKGSIDFTPFKLWKTAERVVRVYNEWLSGDAAWKIQDQLPEGATVLGAVVSSDKTQLSTMTGNRQAHPLLITSANIRMNCRMKASFHAFLLLALVPIPKFIERDVEIRGVLESRTFHAVLDFVLGPLKKVAEIGLMMSDPLDAYRHPPRTRDYTVQQLHQLERHTDPWDLGPYVKKAKLLRLNGVHRPFWHDWPMAEPSLFLTPEILHHWFKFAYDHIVKWCIAALGAAEIDFRFSVLRPHTGMRHFREGISKAKQVTGREHRDILRYLIPVIAEAKVVTKAFITALTSIMNFFYYGQAPELDDDVLDQMDHALATFHQCKSAILKAGVRKGKNGPINNWHIPKLEFLQSVVPAICANGVPLQWTADVTEHAHITEVKDPASNSNNQGYEAQICRHLDRRDKCHLFNLATSMETTGNTEDLDGDDLDAPDHQEPHPLLAGLSSGRTAVNYFTYSASLRDGKYPNAPTPFRTFTSENKVTAFHLNRDHIGHRVTIEDVSTRFCVPDLKDALLAFIQRGPTSPLTIGGRRPKLDDIQPAFTYLQLWHSVRIQTRSYHDSQQLLEPETVKAEPPKGVWKSGRGDPVLVNIDDDYHWPRSGLAGHAICQLKIIFCVVPRSGFVAPAGTDQFLAYVQRFDIVSQPNPEGGANGPFPESSTGMFQLKRSRRADGSVRGDIVPLHRVRARLELTPRFGKVANKKLTSGTSLDYCEDFWLDKWFTKELFWTLSH
ncbi:hypothetical protein B0H16DRAFT_1332097 [Mycena metata]|uniref:DUF6830 domain-containing protein n=1 Tax=Mycena metata TaxID=1033252 RepID=A0AAD7HRC0_9AGAR|nr:hypothetical protein B0H16DRAFT_1332097 [Mycena metata]